MVSIASLRTRMVLLGLRNVSLGYDHYIYCDSTHCSCEKTVAFMSLSARVTAVGFWLGWNFMWLLPQSFTAWCFDLASDFCWRRRIKGVRQLEANLSRALNLSGEDSHIRELSRQAMRAYMRYYCEMFLISRWSPEKINTKVRVENVEPVVNALKSGGVILTLPHSGNWDLAGAWAALNLGTVATVAERLKPEMVFRKFLAMRNKLGMNILPLTGEAGIYEFLRGQVNQGNLVPLLGDRDVARNGMGNTFFGHRASLPVGAAVLALDTNRPLFTCSTWYDGEILVITFDEPVAMPSEVATGRERLRQAQQVSSEIATRFESHIKAHPEDWHMLQPVWSDLVVQ